MSVASAPTLPATLRLGPVELRVAAVDRAVGWYRSVLGLRVRAHEAGRAELGDGATTSVVLVEDPAARPAGRHAGLYHYALLFPTREELARAALRVAVARAPIQGASDHGTHEAIYLPDADGIGIELAWDRPREGWPSAGDAFSGGPHPLDLEDLLAGADGAPPPAEVGEGLGVGHVHLHVGDIEQGLAFYRDTIGFEVWFVMPTAAFVAAGGYHHHLGFNVWQGRGVGPSPEHAVGLRHWTVELPGADAVAEVRGRVAGAGHPVEDVSSGFSTRDPWDIELHVVEAGR